MPTGYTAEIQKGITFEQFALQCARAFGATILMRDEPMDREIPEFEPSDYHVKAKADAELNWQWLMSLTPEQVSEECEKAYKADLDNHIKWNLDKAAIKEKYEAMLVEVKQWEPPTSEHHGLKKFMIEQIEGSIPFDCSPYDLPVKPTPEKWLEKQLADASWSLSYHTEEYQKEVDRTNQRNEWVRQLKQSLQTEQTV